MRPILLMDLDALAQRQGTIALAIAAAVFLFFLSTHRFWLRLLGPIFAIETARLSRRGTFAVLRILYATALLIGLFVIAPRTLRLNQAFLNVLATQFSRAFLVAQSAVVLLLTPLFVAGAVSDEKDKRSLDYLLCTSLSSREIVMGKLA